MNQLWLALLVFLLIGSGVAILTGGGDSHHSRSQEICSR